MSRFALGLVLAILLISAPLCAQDNDEQAPSATLAQAFERLISDLITIDGPPFFTPGARLYLSVETLSGGHTPLNDVLARAARAAITRKGAFVSVIGPEQLALDGDQLDEKALARLDRLGIDRVLDVVAELKGQSLLLRTRAIWLDGGSFAPVMKTPFGYPATGLRVRVAASPQWVLLGRPNEALGRVALGYKRDELFSTSGRILDIAAADLDQDGLTDFVLLLKDRVEIWVDSKNGYAFRYTHSLDDAPLAARQPRFSVGELAICASEGGTPDIYVATNRMSGGLRLEWNGRRLTERSPIGGAPLFCHAGGIATAAYRAGSHLFEPLVTLETSTGESRTLANAAAAFVSAAALPGAPRFLIVDAEGALWQVNEGHDPQRRDIRCGTHPGVGAQAGDPLLVCSEPLALISPDRLSFYTLGTDAAAARSQSDPTPGQIWAVEIVSNWEGDTIYTARFDSGQNRSTLDRYRQ